MVLPGPNGWWISGARMRVRCSCGFSADAKITIYDRGVTKQPKRPAEGLGSYRTFGEFQLLLRAGDVLIPKLEFTEPLKIECQHFVDCIRTGETPRSDGRQGLRVVRTLEAAQRSMTAG